MQAVIIKVMRFNTTTFQNDLIYSVCVYSGTVASALGEPMGTPANRYKSLLHCIECPEGKEQAERIAEEINGGISA